LIQDLLVSQSDVIEPEKVGVITATQKQTQKVRELLRSKQRQNPNGPDLSKVFVHSTEEFHGHEIAVGFTLLFLGYEFIKRLTFLEISRHYLFQQ
jgi:hypothetical protein